MEIVRFVMKNDPWNEPRLGVPLPEGGGVIDLQAGYFSMYERPNPLLRDAEALREGGVQARQVAERVVMWTLAEDPPGVVAPRESVRFLDRDAA